MAKKKATLTAPRSILQLPEGFDPDSITVDGDTVVIEGKGKSMTGAVSRFKYRGQWAQRVDWSDASKSPQTEDE